MFVLFRPLIRSVSYVLACGALTAMPSGVAAQQGTAAGQHVPDTVRALARLDRFLTDRAEALTAVWPGFRFDELGLIYIVPREARLLARWPGQAPEAARRLDGGGRLHWMRTEPMSWDPGLPVAPLLVAPDHREADVLGLAVHEAFHAFEKLRRVDGRRFGQGENTMLTGQYPVMDLENEARFAAEARLLHRAARAVGEAEARRLAGQFLTLRRTRHARLDSAMVEFERAAELHEGLAQYAMLRGLQILAQDEPRLARPAAAIVAAEGEALDSALSAGTSVRRRFYATGAHMGLLLDRLLPEWRRRVIEEDLWLDELLAASAEPGELTTESEQMLAAATVEAAQAVALRRETRGARRDSILGAGSMRLVVTPLALAGSRFDWCSFDPQNLVSTGSGERLHLRMLTVCSGGTEVLALNRASVEDEDTGSIALAVDPEEIRVDAADETVPLPAPGSAVSLTDLQITAEGVTMRARRALLVRGDSALLIVPLAGDQAR